MREFNLSHIVSVSSTYFTTLNSLWGLFVAAAFSAAGFGAAMKDEFTAGVAVALIVAYLSFAVLHLRVLLALTAKLAAIADEVRHRMDTDPQAFTDYPRSARAILDISVGAKAVWIVHLVIDGCVVGIIAASSQ